MEQHEDFMKVKGIGRQIEPPGQLAINLIQAKNQYPEHRNFDTWCSVPAQRDLWETMPLRGVVNYAAMTGPTGMVFWTKRADDGSDPGKIEMEADCDAIYPSTYRICKTGLGKPEVLDELACYIGKHIIEAIEASCRDHGRYLELSADEDIDEPLQRIIEEEENNWLGEPKAISGSGIWHEVREHSPPTFGLMDDDMMIVYWNTDAPLNKYAHVSLYQLPIPIEDFYLARYSIKISDPTKFYVIRKEHG